MSAQPQKSEKELKKERKKEKQRRRIGARAGWALGIGIGALIARMIAPIVAGEISTATDQAFYLGGWSLIAYGGALIGGLVFVKKYVQTLNVILTYMVMPAVLFMIVMDFQS